MSWQASAYVSELTTTPTGDRLTRSEKLLALLLANRHNPDQHMAWPSVCRLAEEAMLSERMTRYLLRSLERKGVITCEYRWIGPKQCTTSVYRFPGLDGEGGGAIIDAPGWGNSCCRQTVSEPSDNRTCRCAHAHRRPTAAGCGSAAVCRGHACRDRTPHILIWRSQEG